jgi:hypothetical protein
MFFKCSAISAGTVEAARKSLNFAQRPPTPSPTRPSPPRSHSLSPAREEDAEKTGKQTKKKKRSRTDDDEEGMTSGGEGTTNKKKRHDAAVESDKPSKPFRSPATKKALDEAYPPQGSFIIFLEISYFPSTFSSPWI